MKNFNDFDTQVQSDEIASLGEGGDWVNDFEDVEDDDECYND